MFLFLFLFSEEARKGKKKKDSDKPDSFVEKMVAHLMKNLLVRVHQAVTLCSSIE